MKFPFTAEDARNMALNWQPSQKVMDTFVSAIMNAAGKGHTSTTINIDAKDVTNPSKMVCVLLEAGYSAAYLTISARNETAICFTVNWSANRLPTKTETQSVNYTKDWNDPEGVGNYRG